MLIQGPDGTVHAFSATCTHQGCPVGSVEDGVIVCPCHGSAFALDTGARVSGPATSGLTARDGHGAGQRGPREVIDVNVVRKLPTVALAGRSRLRHRCPDRVVLTDDSGQALVAVRSRYSHSITPSLVNRAPFVDRVVERCDALGVG